MLRFAQHRSQLLASCCRHSWHQRPRCNIFLHHLLSDSFNEKVNSYQSNTNFPYKNIEEHYNEIPV